MAVASKRDVELSGGLGRCVTSARAGFLPISIERAPLGAFAGIAVFLRVRDLRNKAKTSFTLYCSGRVAFTDDHRQRLRVHGVQFVYIPITDQERFRRQTEATLLQTVEDPSMSTSVKSEIVYETSVELVNELLAEPQALGQSPRIEKLSRAVTMLVLNDPKAFSHLFATSHHDFYTATHMVNVGTWMVPLAYALGHHKPEELNRICRAGLLHDIGKVRIPTHILNKKGPLNDEEWEIVRQHPALGCQYLEQFEGIHPLISTVVRQHHERMNGSGYPDGLAGSQIDPVSRICAVVDSFDAMTALRPFKERTMSVAQALSIISRETPILYDPEVVEAWLRLLRRAEEAGTLHESLKTYDGTTQRQFPRFRIHCQARLHPLKQQGDRFIEKPGSRVIAHNISRSGLGVLSDEALRPNELVRVYLLGRGTLDRVQEGIIVRCRSYEDGWYEIGIKFQTLVEETEVAGLGLLDVSVPLFATSSNSQVPPPNSR